jgi:SP family xylose:H+ symportor-like MFS transporter
LPSAAGDRRRILLSVFQQFVGINAVLYYAPLMFKNLGASTDSALWQTVIVGSRTSSLRSVAILTVDRLGRKPLLIIGGLVMGVAMVTLGSSSRPTPWAPGR